MQTTGRVTDVYMENVSTTAYEDTAAASTTLKVVSAGRLDENGGQVQILDDVYDYDPDWVEGESFDTITITPGLMSDIVTGEEVLVYPVTQQKMATVVQTDSSDESVDEVISMQAIITPGLAATFEVGSRDDDIGEYVQLNDESGDWIITKCYGREGSVRGESIVGPVPTASLSDGVTPDGSPIPVIEAFAIGAMKWTVDPTSVPTNADPVRYKIYADTVDPVTIDDAHEVGDSASTTGVFSTVNGAKLLPDDPTVDATPIFTACVRYDADGSADVSATSAPATARRAALAEISADWVYAGSIEANQVVSGSILTQLLGIGDYIVFDGVNSTITIYQDTAHTVPLVQLKPDGSVFRGRVEADDISVLVGLILQGTNSHISQSAGMTLDASVKDPTVAPTLVAGAIASNWDAVPSGYESRGFSWDGTQWLRLIWKESTTTAKVQKLGTDGHVTATVNLTGGPLATCDNVNSIVKVGSNWFVLLHVFFDGGYNWVIAKYSTAGAYSTDATPNLGWLSKRPALGTDGTNVLCVSAYAADDVLIIELFNTSLAAGAVWSTNPVNWGRANEAFSYVGKDNFDFGASKVVIAGSSSMIVFDLAGTTLTEDTTKYVGLTDNTYYGGFGWDGANFYTAAAGTTLRKYSAYYPGASEKVWVTYADTDTASTKHTKDSPQASLAVVARRYVAATLPPAPAGAATPRVYMGLATSAPADTALLKRAETITGRNLTINPATAGSPALVRTLTVTNKALTSNVATLDTSAAHGLEVGDSITVASVDATFNGTYVITAVPSTTKISYSKTATNVASTAATGTITNTDTNTFGTGTAAWIKSQLGSLELYGDGVLKAPKIQVPFTKASRQTSAFNIATGSELPINMNTFSGSGTGGTTDYYHWDSSSGVRAWVIDVAGVYAFAGALNLAASATGRRTASIRVNGSSTRNPWTRLHTVDANDVHIGVSGEFNLLVGDTVDLAGFQNSGGDLDTVNSWLSIRRVGELAA